MNNWQVIYNQIYNRQRTFQVPMAVARDFVNRSGAFEGFNIGNWDQSVLDALTKIIDRLKNFYLY